MARQILIDLSYYLVGINILLLLALLRSRTRVKKLLDKLERQQKLNNKKEVPKPYWLTGRLKVYKGSKEN